MTPGMVHQDSPHQLRRNGEKMGAILPLHALVVDQASVGFIHQRGCLEAVARALALHVAARQAAEFVVNDGGEFFQGAWVSSAPSAEQNAYFTGLRRTVHRWAELYRDLRMIRRRA